MTADLRTLIREVAQDHPLAQPNEIARYVAKLTPPDEVFRWYEESLRPVVASVLRDDRNRALHNALPGDTPEPVAPEPQPDVTEHHDEPRHEPVTMPRPAPRSSKRDGIRTWWQTMLETLVHTEAGHKLLGDCTRDDLEFCINEREAHIADVKARIRSYQRLMALLDAHGVQTVRELPEQAA